MSLASAMHKMSSSMVHDDRAASQLIRTALLVMSRGGGGGWWSSITTPFTTRSPSAYCPSLFVSHLLLALRPFPSYPILYQIDSSAIMPDCVSYSTVMNVCLSWDKLKRVPNYRERAGELILLRYVVA